jgi:hypothetical protein
VPETNTASRSNQASHFPNCKEKKMEWLKHSVRMLCRDRRACRQGAAEDHAGTGGNAHKNRMQEKGIPAVFLRLGWANV